MKQKFIDFMGLSEKDLQAIKIGFRVMFRTFLVFAAVFGFVVGMYYLGGFKLLNVIGYSLLGFVAFVAVVIVLIAIAQTIGEKRLEVWEEKTVIIDGKECHYTVLKKD